VEVKEKRTQGMERRGMSVQKGINDKAGGERQSLGLGENLEAHCICGLRFGLYRQERWQNLDVGTLKDRSAFGRRGAPTERVCGVKRKNQV